jgi:hypothetical protein
LRTYRLHIAQCISAIVLIASLLLPAVVNLLHSAEGHDHFDKCENPSNTHIHKKKLDCKLFDVTLNKNGVFTATKEITFIALQDIPEKTIHAYTIYRKVYSTTTSRGPPNC